MNTFNGQTMMNNNNQQQSTSFESGLPSVGSIVSNLMKVFHGLRNILLRRFGQLDVRVHNKHLIYMLILIISVHILMLNPKKLFNGLIQNKFLYNIL
jgi:hypothetical protein